MKTKRIFTVLFAFVICICVSACSQTSSGESDIWKAATYTSDTSLGEGEKAFELEVKAGVKSVTFNVNTDADNLEDALTEYNLIEGEKGPYGLYVKKVNGITADYDIDKRFWSLCQNGTPLMTGVGDTEVKGGEHFEFIREKG